VAAAWAHESAASRVATGDLSWSLRPEVVLPLLVLAGVYALGWSRLSRRTSRSAGTRRPALVLVGLAALGLALLSPLDGLADTLFVAHMLQHMLLVMVAAPALLLADPFPAVVWALPGAARLRARRWIRRASVAGRLWQGATAMPVAWILSACILWGWHLPGAYDAALSHRFLHDVEHLSFFAGALLFWWPVIHPAPRFRRGAAYPLRVVYLVLGAFQRAALGLWLTLAPAVLYRSYAEAGGPRALEDQMWGGVVMWGLGGLIDTIAVLVLVHRSLGVVDMGGLARAPRPPGRPEPPGEPGALLDYGAGGSDAASATFPQSKIGS
jgi:cytochrome c oxidase assembly factor CtaG